MLSVCSAFGECGAPPRWNEISFAGKQLVQLGTVSGTSPLSGVSPAIQAGYVWVPDQRSTPGNYLTNPTATGDFSIASGGDTSRQIFFDDVYNLLLRSYYGQGAVVVNNLPPYLIGGAGSALLNGQVFKKSASSGTIAFAPYFNDPEGDTFTVSLASGVLPTGWSALASNGNTGGTPTVYGTYNYEIEVEDQYGDSIVVADFAVIGDEIPDVEDDLKADAITAVEAVANFTTVVTTERSATIAAGRVIRTDPAAGQYAPDDQEVTLTVSLGEEAETQRRRYRYGFGFGFGAR